MTRVSENTISSEKMHAFHVFSKTEYLTRSVAFWGEGGYSGKNLDEGADENQDCFCVA